MSRFGSYSRLMYIGEKEMMIGLPFEYCLSAFMIVSICWWWIYVVNVSLC
jgi:hypothetical protein